MRPERLPRDVQGRPAGPLSGPPDVAVESFSEGQGANRIIEKLWVLVANGWRAGLLLDPCDQTVGVLRLWPVFKVLEGDEVLALPEVAESARIPVRTVVAALWPAGSGRRLSRLARGGRGGRRPPAL